MGNSGTLEVEEVVLVLVEVVEEVVIVDVEVDVEAVVVLFVVDEAARKSSTLLLPLSDTQRSPVESKMIPAGNLMPLWLVEGVPEVKSV